jgi:hypothetical protein
VRAEALRLQAFGLRAAPTIDAGTAQRSALEAALLHPLANVEPVPQRLAASPANTYPGYTKPIQEISAPTPSIEQADPVAGVSKDGAGQLPILPSTRHRPPVI